MIVYKTNKQKDNNNSQNHKYWNHQLQEQTFRMMTWLMEIENLINKSETLMINVWSNQRSTGNSRKNLSKKNRLIKKSKIKYSISWPFYKPKKKQP